METMGSKEGERVSTNKMLRLSEGDSWIQLDEKNDGWKGVNEEEKK